jgi:hypothetical protein
MHDVTQPQPRALVAHQHARDLFLLALLSTHPQPAVVVRRFRKLVDELTWDTDSADDQSYLSLVHRSAAAFDRMIQDLLLATDGQSSDSSTSEQTNAGSAVQP